MKTVLNVLLILTMMVTGTFANASTGSKSIFDTSALSSFSNDSEFLRVEEAFLFDFYQRDNQLEITFNIQPGYYLYRHQFKFIGKNAELIVPELPEGEHHEDEYFGVQQVYRGKLALVINLAQVSDDGVINIRYQGCADKGLCYPPTIKTIELEPVSASSQNVLSALGANGGNVNNKGANMASAASLSEQNLLARALLSGDFWIIITGFFIGGLLLSFTPCVFPMYPILTGIIVGQGDKLSNKKAFSLSFTYVQGMAITYTILGIVVALAGAQFQAMFQHPIVLIALSVLFIALALSMFGVFNLALPTSWQNKLNNMSRSQEGGSYTGVLSMGAISGLVASPCTTAPLTGALLYISQTGDIVIGASALYALSLGMGLPLLVLGSSGGKLLPKAGTWMNVIKNIFGILLLAVPVFLLERFIPALWSTILWSVLILGAASYFYVANLSTNKNFFHGVRVSIIFVMMFFAANSLYNLINPPAPSTQVSEAKEFIYAKDLAELEVLVQQANAKGQTVMVDLYADWCIACKEFEHQTFPKPSVQAALANSVLIQVDLTDAFAPNTIELMGEYEVFGLPSILFFDTEGNELSDNRVTGFMNAKDFAAHINAIF